MAPDGADSPGAGPPAAPAPAAPTAAQHKQPLLPMVLDEEPSKSAVFRRQHCAHREGTPLRAFVGPTDTAWMQQHQRWWVRTAEKVEAKEGTERKIRRRQQSSGKYPDSPGGGAAGAGGLPLPELYGSHESDDMGSDWSSSASDNEDIPDSDRAQTGAAPPNCNPPLSAPEAGSGRCVMPMPELPPSPRPDSPQTDSKEPGARHRSSLSAIKRLFHRHSVSRATAPQDGSPRPAPSPRRSLDAVLGGLTVGGGASADSATTKHDARRGRATSQLHTHASLGLNTSLLGQPAIARGPAEPGATSPRLPSLRRIAVTRSSLSNAAQPLPETSPVKSPSADVHLAVERMSDADIQLQVLAATDKLGVAVSPAPSRVWRARKAVAAKVRASYRRHAQLSETAVLLSTRAVIRQEKVAHDALADCYNETTCRRFRESAREWTEMWLALTKRGVLFYFASKRRPVVAVLFPPHAQVAPQVSLFSTLDLSLAILYYGRDTRTSTSADDPAASKAALRAAIIKFPSSQVACEWYREIGQALLLGRVMYPGHFLRECPPAAQPPPDSVVVNVPEIGVKVQVKLGRHSLPVPAGVLHGGPDDALLERQWRCEATTAWHVRRDAVRALLSDKVVGSRVREWLEAERRGELAIGMAWRRYDRLDWIMPCGALGVDGRFMVGQVNDRVVGPQLLEGTHTLELRVLEHYPDSAVVDGRRVGEPLGVEGFVMLKRDKQRKVEMATYRPALLTTHDGFLFFVHAPRAVRHLDACASGCSSPPAGTEADAEHHPPSAELLFAPPRRPSYKSFASIRSSSSAVAGEPVVRYYHPTADGCSKQMRLAKYMLCITDVEHIVPVAPEAEGTAAGGSDPGQMRSKGRLLGLLRSKKNQQSACKLRLVTRVGTAVELWTASPQCVSEWVHRLTELRYYWTNRMMTDLSLRSRACMLNYAIQGRGNRHRDMVDWSDEGAVAERAIWHACLILGCRSIIMAGVLYRKRDRHQGMQKVFCVLTQGNLIEFAYPPLPLPPAHTALAEHIAGHNPVMAQMFQGADDGITAPSGAKSPAAHVGGQPSGGADAQLLFSRSRALSLCHCYVVSRFSDDLSTGDIMCEPWVLTDIGNYSGLRLADRMYADGIVSHELITDCIFTVWRPSAVPAILRADGGQALGQIPRDLSDIGEMAPGERSPGSGSESNCSSPRQSIGSAEREHVATPTEKRPAAGCQSAPSSPRAHGGRHWRRASQGTTPHPPDAPRKSGDSILSSASNVSSTSSSPRRDAGRPGAHVVGNEIRLNVDDRHDGRMHMGASRSASKARRRVGVYRARTNAEMAQWVTAINQEIRRMSLTGEW